MLESIVSYQCYSVSIWFLATHWTLKWFLVWQIIIEILIVVRQDMILQVIVVFAHLSTETTNGTPLIVMRLHCPPLGWHDVNTADADSSGPVLLLIQCFWSHHHFTF